MKYYTHPSDTIYSRFNRFNQSPYRTTKSKGLRLGYIQDLVPMQSSPIIPRMSYYPSPPMYNYPLSAMSQYNYPPPQNYMQQQSTLTNSENNSFQQNMVHLAQEIKKKENSNPSKFIQNIDQTNQKAIATDHRVLNLLNTDTENSSKDPDLEEDSFLQDDKIKQEIDSIIKNGLTSIISNSGQSVNSDNRELLLHALGSMGKSASSSLSNSVKSMANGGAGLGIGVGAAGLGLMMKKRREAKHRFNLQRINMKLAGAHFSADFQDQAITELSRIVEKAKFMDSRLKTLKNNTDFTLGKTFSAIQGIV